MTAAVWWDSSYKATKETLCPEWQQGSESQLESRVSTSAEVFLSKLVNPNQPQDWCCEADDDLCHSL